MKIISISLAISLLFLFITPVLAQSTIPTRKPTRKPVPTKIIRPTAGEVTGVGPTNNQLRSCQARQEAIKTRSTNLTDFSVRLITTFDSIATRTQDFYTTKVLSRGGSVPNYATLVADITTKKNIAQSALTKAQATIIDFDCATSDPTAVLTDFNQSMKDFKMAINDYKASVRNLIVAVRGQASRVSPQLTPKVTRLPKVGGNQ